MEEVDYHRSHDNPVTRLKQYLINQGMWTELQDEEWIKIARQEVG